MEQYEVVFIVTPVLAEADLKKMVSGYKDLLKKEKVEMINEESWGIRQLAYPIQKKTTGHYFLFEFKAVGDVIAKLELAFKRDENVLRYLSTRQDKYMRDYSERRRKGQIGKKKAAKEKEEIA